MSSDKDTHGQAGLALDPPGLGSISPTQWKTGIAAWLGWLFDGLEMHIFTLIGPAFVVELMRTTADDPAAKARGSWIMGAFLVGWAVGGTVFGRLGDRLGRSRVLSLTIFTYAIFTGLSFFAHAWWHLLIFRFVAALGIGGEWAVGSCLLAETWPARLRPWVAAVLQTGVNLGVLLAFGAAYVLASSPPRYIFLVGVLPALLVFWIRRNVPEPEVWNRASESLPEEMLPRASDLFRAPVRHITVLTAAVCACSLTAWWAFTFWGPQHLRHLPDVRGKTIPEINHLVSAASMLVILISIAGNFFAGWLARQWGYRRAIVLMFLGFFVTLFTAYGVPRDHVSLIRWMGAVGFFSGVFGLFTMYLPALFPTLLRSSGAGFSFNIGRIAAAIGTVVFGLFSPVGDFRRTLLCDSLLLAMAMVLALFLPDVKDGRG